jgi:hypothetical protein
VTRRALLFTLGIVGLLLTAVGPAALAAPPAATTAAGEPPVAIRIEWGEGRPRAWGGTIRVVEGASGRGQPPPPLRWHLLGTDADAAASVHAEGDTLFVHDARPRERNGVECAIADWRTARIVMRLAPLEEPQAITDVDVAVAAVLADSVPRQLDNDGNRLTIARAPGEAVRVVLPHGSWPATSPVYRAGEVVRLEVHPLLVARAGSMPPRELSLRVRDVTADVELLSETKLIHPDDTPAVAAGENLAAQSFQPLAFEIALPDRDAVCSVMLEIVERGSLGWSRPVASRTFELLAVGDEPAPAAEGEWRVVYELDPASPRLHERLRRLSSTIPSLPMPALPMPAMKLPALPFPSMTRPKLPLPRMPAVPLPSVSSIVPRISGLLSHGDSTVEPHPLGPMLQLPPAPAAGRPAWEGIVVAGAEIGRPHLVEIEYPQDQQATFGVSVLEAGDTGAVVQARYAGGFAVESPAAGISASDDVGRHSFVFWPTSSNPVVLVMNASPQTPALFGKVRVFTGPAGVPPMQAVAPTAAGVDPLAGRPIHGFVASPAELTASGGGSLGADTARLPAGWAGTLAGVRRSAEWLAAQGAGGAMVTVYRDGGAIWPAECTKGAPRWSGGGDAGRRTAVKDVLDVLCRVYGREGLRLVPALSFNAPLPALEAALAHAQGPADAATGIVLVGGDGKLRRLPDQPASLHYNILDPRVQQAVEAVVGEVAGRLNAAATVDGVAILLTHEGWLHLPGVAWGLDDVTFGRFAAAAGVPPGEGADRHAQRAAFVTGSGREAWLAWRSHEIASFYSRLAEIVSVEGGGRSLYVAPTTLLAMGDLSRRLRPALAGSRAAEADLWREIGVDPATLTADERIVFLSPHVHRCGGGLIDRAASERANRSAGLARGVAGARRRGAIAIEVPLRMEIDDVVPHGPFGAAAAEGAVAVHPVRSGPALTRAWAESFVAGDAEVIFDMALMYAQPTLAGVLARRAFAALPPGSLALVDPLPAPLVIRTGPSQLGTSLLVVNAAAVPVQAAVELTAPPTVAADAVDGGRLTIDEQGRVSIPLEPWGIRSVVVDSAATVAGARAEFSDATRESIARQLADLKDRQAAVERPAGMAVLDNPDFELPGTADGATGWEVVDRQRGTLVGIAAGRTEGGRAVEFSSLNGLATIRSNPFVPPTTGRISVAAWLRLAASEPQPPLRLAVEGVDRQGEYYRFAPMGGLPGGRPLGETWTQFVLQIDDLPQEGLESLRVRFDLMGPGRVEIDDIRVYGMALNEAERTQLAELISRAEARLAAGDVGGCGLLLDSFWPQFLLAHVAGGGGQDEAGDQPGGQPIARPPRRWTWR